MKQCTKCKEFLSESLFNKSNRNKNGLRAECRVCQSKEAKRYSNNPIVKAMKFAYRQIAEHKEAYRKADQKRNDTEHRRVYKREKAHEQNVMDKKRESSKVYKSITTNQIKLNAHSAVRDAIRKGILIRGQCEYEHFGDCYGTPQGHHEDYEKPLEVRWLCGRHHKRVHLHILK